MQKIKKILRAVSEKTALPPNQPTNQSIITNNTDVIGPHWRRSKNAFTTNSIIPFEMNDLNILKRFQNLSINKAQSKLNHILSCLN